MTQVSMRDMLKAGAHFGHQTRYCMHTAWCGVLLRVAQPSFSAAGTLRGAECHWRRAAQLQRRRHTA